MVPGGPGSARTADEEQVRAFPRLMMNSTEVRGRVGSGWRPRSWESRSELWVAAQRKMFIDGRAEHVECFQSMKLDAVAVAGSVAGKCAPVVAQLAAGGVARTAVVAAGGNESPRSSGKITQARGRPRLSR